MNCLSNPSYKLDARLTNGDVASGHQKMTLTPVWGLVTSRLPLYCTCRQHLLHHILSCPMSIRQRATRAPVQGDSKSESVAGDHSKPSEVSKLLYSLSSLDIKVLDLFIDTPDFVNPRCVPCDLCRGPLSLALLVGYFDSVTTSTLLTRVTWR